MFSKEVVAVAKSVGMDTRRDVILRRRSRVAPNATDRWIRTGRGNSSATVMALMSRDCPVCKKSSASVSNTCNNVKHCLLEPVVCLDPRMSEKIHLLPQNGKNMNKQNKTKKQE